MNFRLTKVASALSFAHLAGIGRGRAAAKGKADADSAEDDDDKKKPAEDDDEQASAAGAEGGDRDSDEDKDKPGASASSEDDDADDGESDDGEDKPKSKGKAKADADDDAEEEMRGDSKAAAARRREQGRCAAIFASPAAARNPVLAAKLAFTTRMRRDEAVALLEASPAPAAAGPGHAGRAARNPNVGAGAHASPIGPQAIAGSWDAAFAKAGGAGRSSAAGRSTAQRLDDAFARAVGR